jgi:acyl carrier protein
VTDKAEILTGLNEIIKEATAGMVQNVTAEQSFAEDLDIDSLAIVEIVVLAEKKFSVKIPEGEIANFTTVGDTVNYISANL